MSKFTWWVREKIVCPLRQFYYKHHKAHYVCGCCGLLAAPYFEDLSYKDLKEDYGWKHISRHNWMCHQCAYHVSSPGWAATVEENNNKIRFLIWAKDHDYWQKHFERKA